MSWTSILSMINMFWIDVIRDLQQF
jgi:hypothetical protein